jgi:spore coat protein U-like protein
MSLISPSLRPMHSLLARWASVGLFLAASAAHAATCSVNDPTLAFGTYVPSSGSPTDSIATITVQCNDVVTSVSYTIGLEVPAGDRKLAANTGGYTLDYQLYRESSRTTVWNNTNQQVSGSITAPDVSNNHTIYGRISASQTSAGAASYSQSISITLTYD